MLWIPLALLLILLLPGIFFYFIALFRWKRRRPRKKGGSGGPHSFREDRDWIESAPQENVYIRSRDGLKLHGRLILQDDGSKFALLCHGYRAHSASLSHYARNLYARGFSLLMSDARAHGGSEGRSIGMGWPERLDILDWIAMLNERFSAPDILLMGVSMGGATVMNAGGEALPGNVRGIVSDCGFVSIRDEFVHQLRRRRLPARYMLRSADIVCRVLAGYSVLRDGDTCAQLRRCSLPMLIIHGDADDYVPPVHFQRACAAKPDPRWQLLVAGAAHADSALSDPEAYWSAVDSFLEHCFPGRT